MNFTNTFSGLASDYASGRPTYSQRFIKSLYRDYGFSADSVIADIGSGTGKFAAQMIDRGSFVYLIEPNDDMRELAMRELKSYGNCRCVCGDASNTALENSSVDFVTAAQAFHWFDVEAFKKECKRILKPEGRIFLIWNVRDVDSEINQKNRRIYEKYCPGFKGFSGGIKNDDARIRQFFDGAYVKEEYSHPLNYSCDKFISRCLSSSYSLRKNDEGYEEYIGELKELFETYAVNGMMTVPNKTMAYIGCCG